MSQPGGASVFCPSIAWVFFPATRSANPVPQVQHRIGTLKDRERWLAGAMEWRFKIKVDKPQQGEA